MRAFVTAVANWCRWWFLNVRATTALQNTFMSLMYAATLSLLTCYILKYVTARQGSFYLEIF